MPRRPRFGLLLVCALVLTSCAISSIEPPASAEVIVPSPSGEGVAADCEPINLLTPSGERLDLKGTWTGPFGPHYVRQDGSCVWWVGLGARPAEDPDAQIIVMFRGELLPDFTISGEWMLVNRPSFLAAPLRGQLTWVIEVEAAGGSQTLTLRNTAEGESDGAYQGGATLVYEGPLPPFD